MRQEDSKLSQWWNLISMKSGIEHQEHIYCRWLTPEGNRLGLGVKLAHFRSAYTWTHPAIVIRGPSMWLSFVGGVENGLFQWWPSVYGMLSPGNMLGPISVLLVPFFPAGGGCHLVVCLRCQNVLGWYMGMGSEGGKDFSCFPPVLCMSLLGPEDSIAP